MFLALYRPCGLPGYDDQPAGLLAVYTGMAKVWLSALFPDMGI